MDRFGSAYADPVNPKSESTTQRVAGESDSERKDKGVPDHVRATIGKMTSVAGLSPQFSA